MESDQATTRMRSATAQFDFPNVSYINEYEFDIEDAVGTCPYAIVALFTSMEPNPYPDLFAFWPDALRCLAEYNVGEIFREWDRLGRELSCTRLASSELVSRVADAVTPFSRSQNVPTVPGAFSQAFEVLGVPGFDVCIGTWGSDEEHYLLLAVEMAAA